MQTPTPAANGIRLRFDISHPERLHQVQLLIPTTVSDPDGGVYSVKLEGCHRFDAQDHTIEFVTSGLIEASQDYVLLAGITKQGSRIGKRFPIAIADLRPSLKVDSDIRPPSVPTTGTWLGVPKPSGLRNANFVIRPGGFAVFVHENQQPVIRAAGFHTYRLGFAFGKNARNNDFPNLTRFLKNGGRIELVSHATLNPLPATTRTPKRGDLVISEIMWGLNGAAKGTQYIEVYNASQHTYTFVDGNVAFRFSKTSDRRLPDEVFPLPTNPNASVKVIDRVSNTGWKVPGRSGNTSKNQGLVSMYRRIDYTTGDTPDGTLASSWQASTGRLNLPAPSYGTPGAQHLPPAPAVRVPQGNPPPLYWINTASGTLHRLVGTAVEPLVPTATASTGLAIDAAAGKLYWTERTGERTGQVRRSNLDGSQVRVVKKLTSLPRGLALDTIHRKIYLINAYGKVQRMNLDGSGFQPNLITGLRSPGQIAVDAAGGKLYWTEGSRLRRADLNGGNIQEVVTRIGAPGHIAVGIAPATVRPAAAPALFMQVPVKTALLANYPNPFNPETWIPYQLAEDTAVRITIYNPHGGVVRSLSLGQQSAGDYTTQERAAYWDGRNAFSEQVASGIYFYQLETDTMSAMRKMVILK